MRPSLRIGRAISGPEQSTARALVAVFAATLLFAAATAGTLHLKHVGERGDRTQEALRGILIELSLQDAMVSQVVSGRKTPMAGQADLVLSRDRSAALTSTAGREGLSTSGELRISTVNRDYAAAVDRELELLSTGRSLEAANLDQSEVAPAYAVAGFALRGYADQVSDSVQRAGTQSSFPRDVAV